MSSLFPEEKGFRGATISGQYRYDLWVQRDARPPLVCIGLNPSTANEAEWDPTTKKLLKRATPHGGLVMLNLFAYRSTDPHELMRVSDPVGPENDAYLLKHAESAGLILACWGVGGDLEGRAEAVMKLLAGKEMWCLGLTKEGQPRHPLYVADASEIERFAL